MNKVSLAVLISLSTLAGAAYAQTENGITMSTDPQKIAEFEQHAQEVQAHQGEAQPARMAPARVTREHPGVKKHHPYVGKSAPAQ
ncbi:MAG: hypothetical protein EPN70_16805 [Paraburkholderia sp.]|uniref:hypothetical protein n=1 Tax=Paraburkholderia sp. TaxID=1926495 RepID=UPI0012155BAB|nr:hypothetical protein [Paraburkholderia sp.]TAM02457.1 MAG: hypothetical protein EPN70_16805 [Paraburkholderia sp.]TAM28099.1 MAG: hypothetical protein EPN59_18205 [Paraburkholderia sp.]